MSELDRPSPARMYDFFLGGKDNLEVDRVAGRKVEEATPETGHIVWENRRFLQRATRYIAGQGVRRFLDVGTGLPTVGNVHETAREITSEATVVYVDNDPVVLAHGRAVLASDRRAVVVAADMRDPEEVLSRPEVAALITDGRPVAVLLVAVLHFVTDAQDPAGIVAAFRDALPPGSYLALSHLTYDGPPVEAVERITDVYTSATAPLVFRSLREIHSLFGGFELVPPGLVRPWMWRNPSSGDGGTLWIYAGVGRKPDHQ